MRDERTYLCNYAMLYFWRQIEEMEGRLLAATSLAAASLVGHGSRSGGKALSTGKIEAREEAAGVRGSATATRDDSGRSSVQRAVGGDGREY
jgi:hypothetical protein